jgi:S-phase kinase-associated protein 1
MSEGGEKDSGVVVLLQAADQIGTGRVFLVEGKTARKSETIKNMLEDVSMGPIISLPNITARTLARVIECCNSDVLPPPLPQLEQPELVELILAANYLDIKPLLTALSTVVVKTVVGKTTAEICPLFGGAGCKEFTPEQEEQLRKENADWCEER